MQMQRTIRIRLRPNAATAEVLTRTAAAFTWSFNEVCRHGWEHGVTNGAELHKATYYVHRTRTGLPAQLTCAARVKATEALKAVNERLRQKKKVSCPQSSCCAIRFDARSHRVWFDKRRVSLLTLEGRVKLDFRLPKYFERYTSWSKASADLIHDRKGRWWLHVVVTRAIDTPPPSEGEIVGVDLGIVNPATDSRGIHYGRDHWKDVESRHFQHWRRLHAKGTKSARRRLKSLSGRMARFRRDCDHVLSKQLVHSVAPGGTLVLENLTDIRRHVSVSKKQRRRLHSWSFRRLEEFIAYKATARGLTVVYVDPRYTSQTCAKCGHLERGNRKRQDRFSCMACGHTSHADMNAAINIRMRFVSSQGCLVNQPIVSSQVIH